MARNREPVLKRAKALGIEPQYMGINKKSKRQAQQSRRKKLILVILAGTTTSSR